MANSKQIISFIVHYNNKGMQPFFLLVSTYGYRQVTFPTTSEEWFTPHKREPPVYLFS